MEKVYIVITIDSGVIFDICAFKTRPPAQQYYEGMLEVNNLTEEENHKAEIDITLYEMEVI